MASLLRKHNPTNVSFMDFDRGQRRAYHHVREVAFGESFNILDACGWVIIECGVYFDIIVSKLSPDPAATRVLLTSSETLHVVKVFWPVDLSVFSLPHHTNPQKKNSRASCNNRGTAQLRELNGQAPRRRATSINQNRQLLLLVALDIPWEWQFHGVIKRLPHGKNSHTKRSRFFKREVVWNLDLDIAFGGDVIAECAVLVVNGISTVGEASDAVTFLETLGYGRANFL